MAKAPKREQFIHDRYWIVSPYYGPRDVSADDAREAWKAADRVDGTAEFGFQTTVYTDQHRSTLNTVIMPMTGYPLPPELSKLIAASGPALTLVDSDEPEESAERVRLRHKVSRRLGMMLALLALAVAVAGCASTGKAGSGHKGANAAAKGGYGCDIPPGADALASCCKVGTESPKVVGGAVHGAVEVSCTEPPEYYALTAFLYRADSKADAHPGAWHEADVCTQSDPADIGLGGKQGARCTVATACVPGYYVTAWDIDVSINGAAGYAADDGTYSSTITKTQCRG